MLNILCYFSELILHYIQYNSHQADAAYDFGYKPYSHVWFLHALYTYVCTWDIYVQYIHMYIRKRQQGNYVWNDMLIGNDLFVL